MSATRARALPNPQRAAPRSRTERLAALAARLLRSPFHGVSWTPAYLALLVYMAGVTTQRIAIGTASMAVAILTMLTEREPYRVPPIVGWALAFLTWGFVGYMLTDYPDVAVQGLSDYAKICAVLFVTVNVVGTRSRFRTLLVFTMICFCIYPVRGTLLNWAYGITTMGRVAWNGVYQNPNDLAGLCLLQLALALGILQVERQWWIRAIAFGTMIALPFMVLVTQSRGAFFALVVFALVAGRRFHRDVKKLALLVLFSLAMLFVAPDSIWQRMSSITADKESAIRTNDEAGVSAVQRVEILKVSRMIVAENPVFGVGLNAYGIAHYFYAQRPGVDPLAWGIRDSHNTYLHVAAETGVIGFLIFAGLVVSTLREARRVRRKHAATHPAAAAQLFYLELGAYAYLVAGIWGSYDELVFTYLYFALIVIAAHLLEREAAPPTTPVRRLRGQWGRRGVPARAGAVS